MKKTVKRLCMFMSIVVLLSVYLPVCAVEQIVLESSATETKDEKIYSNASIEQDFVDNHVLVVMDKSVSAVNKTHDLSLFRSVDTGKVTDLTRIDTPKIESNVSSFTTNKTQLIVEQKVPLLNVEEFRQILLVELPIHSKSNVLETIKQLEKIDGVKYAGPDYITYQDSTISDDDYVGFQWAIDTIQLDEAWDITTGSDDVCVGIIDSGIASHPDINDNVVQGWDFHNENNITTDDATGHGTHIAGIIGADGDNGIGIAGVAWNIKLVPLQITYDLEGHSYTSDTIESIVYAINNNIPILNYSNGSYNESESFRQAVANYSGLFICSAGNDKINVDNKFHHASSYKLQNMISVANTTILDELNEYINADGELKGSNYGKNTVHLSAPGTSIYSCYLDSSYEFLSGTSMAAPYVTGVAALIKSIRPDLTALEIKALILDNVDIPVDDNGDKKLKDKCITEGRLNAYKAVLAATESQTFTGDVNGDDRADVILLRNVGGMRALTVYLGQNNGAFSEPITTQSSRTFYYNETAFVGDFDGDGLTDVLVQWEDDYRALCVYRSRGDGSFCEGADLFSSSEYISNSAECSYHVADVNGDDKDDFIVQYQAANGFRNALVYEGSSSSPYLLNTTTNALVESLNVYSYSEPVYIGDFNGDGMSDMLVHCVNSAGKRLLRIHVGASDGTFMYDWVLTSFQNHYPERYPTKNFVADVDEDGYDDFVVQWKNDNSCISVLVYKGRSSGPYLLDATTDVITSTYPYVDTDPVFMGDVNGDRAEDMVVHSVDSNGYRQLIVYRLDGTASEATVCNTPDIHNPSNYSERVLLADVNGDGRSDVIVKRKVSGKVQFMTYLGTTTGSFGSAITTNPTAEIPYYDHVSGAYTGAGTYKIINVGANKCLNVYGDNVTVLYNQQNVCLWEDSGTNEQKWYVTGLGNSQYIKSVIDTDFGLNVYRAGSPWNCDLYPTAGNETDSLIDFIASGDGFRIKLHNYDLFLTVDSSGNGANVYWSAFWVSSYQVWNLVSA